MDFTIIFFVLMSVLVLGYILYIYLSDKRVNTLVEVFFIFIFSFVILILIFPGILRFIEQSFGISSALQFIVYLSIFVSYFLLFVLYKRQETQRSEITKLVRELALSGKKK